MELRKYLPSFLQKRSTSAGSSNLKNPADWMLAAMGGLSESGEVVNASTATKLSAVYACISLNAETLASLPLHVIDKSQEVRKQLFDHPVYHLLYFQPNPSMTAFHFWETVMVHLQTHGNAYARIIRNAIEVPVRLELLKPQEVSVYQTTDGDVFYTHKGQTIEAYNMLHYRGWSQNGLLGIAPITAAADTIGLGLSAQKFGNKYFKNGTHQQGVLEMDGELGDEAWEAFQKHWKASHARMKNSFDSIPVLEYGMKWKDISIPPDQAQFILTREFQLEEVCRIFRVPPHLIADLRRATFSNIEHQDIQYAKYTIRGYCKRIEKENNIKLFPRKKWGMEVTKFNLEGLLRGDIKTRAVYYKTGLGGAPFLTRNEVRQQENLPPVEGGDKILDPLNMVDPKKLDNSQTE